MARTEVRFRGQGGQGLITLGAVYARGISIFDKRHAVLTEFYGAEKTGGFARADVVIADSEIDYPLVHDPEYFVIMSQEAWDHEKDNGTEDAIIIYETTLVKIDEADKRGRKFYGIPALELAYELGNKVVANVILMGAMQEITELISKESLEKALFDRVPKRFINLNKNAIKTGYEYGKKLMNGGK